MCYLMDMSATTTINETPGTLSALLEVATSQLSPVRAAMKLNATVKGAVAYYESEDAVEPTRIIRAYVEDGVVMVQHQLLVDNEYCFKIGQDLESFAAAVEAA